MAVRRQKVIDLVNSLFDIERKVVDLFLDSIPGEAKEHAKSARKEQLMALRSLLDTSIKKLEEAEKKGKKGPKKVEVE